MMYFLLILFFVSLISISTMIGRKIVLIKNGQLPKHTDENMPPISYLEEWRDLTFQTIKKHSHLGLVGTIRLYVRSMNFQKKKYEQIRTKVKNIKHKRAKGKSPSEVKPNNFLKMVSDYKHKVRRIKHQIKVEEEDKKGEM